MSLLTPTGILPLYESLEKQEQTLNISGYIPFLGSLTGHIIRGTLAVAELVTGVCIELFYLFASASNPLIAFYGMTSVVLLKQGAMNLLRSKLEQHPLTALLLCLPIDLISGRIFAYPL